MCETKKDSAEELNLLADIKHPKVNMSKPLPYYIRQRMKEYTLLAEINEFGTFKSETHADKEHITDLISGKCIDSVAKIVEPQDTKDLKIKSLILAAKYIISDLITGELESYEDIEGVIGYDNLIKMANYLMYRRPDLFNAMAATLLNNYYHEKIFCGDKGETVLGLCLQSVTSNFANREVAKRYYNGSEVVRNFINKLSVSEEMEDKGINFVGQAVASFSNLVGKDAAYTRSVCSAIDIMKNPRVSDWMRIKDPFYTPFIELSLLFTWCHSDMSEAEIKEDADYVREHVGMMCEDNTDIFPKDIVDRLESGDPTLASLYLECGNSDSNYYLLPTSIFDRFPKFIIAAWTKLGEDDRVDSDVFYRAVANLTLKAQSLKEVTDFLDSVGMNLTNIIDDCVDGLEFGSDENGDIIRTPSMYVIMNVMRLLGISGVSEEFQNHCRDKFTTIYARKLTKDNPFFIAVSYPEPAFHAVRYTDEQIEEIIKYIGYSRVAELLTYDNFNVIAKYHDEQGEKIPMYVMVDDNMPMDVADKFFDLATAEERRTLPFPIEYMQEKGSDEFDKYITTDNVDRYIQAYGLKHAEDLIAIPIMKILMFNSPSLYDVIDNYLDIIMNDTPARNILLGRMKAIDYIRGSRLLPEVMRAKEIDEDAKAQLLYTCITTDKEDALSSRAIVSFVNMLDPNDKYAGLCLTLAARKATTDEDNAAIDTCIANINRG